MVFAPAAILRLETDVLIVKIEICNAPLVALKDELNELLYALALWNAPHADALTIVILLL